MTSRQFALEIPIEGKDLISRALQQAQRLVQGATQAVNRILASTERSMDQAGRSAERLGSRIRQSVVRGM